MLTKKPLKNPKEFKCMKCAFICSNKKDYTRHLMTAKHKRLTNANQKTPKNPLAYNCICGKKYKHLSSLSKHKKTCSFIIESKNEIIQTTEETTTNKDQLILELLAQNKELINILNDTVPKIGDTTNTINNTNNFNLQVFLNEDCRDALNFSDFISDIQVSFTDLEYQSRLGYADGISKLFIENLQGLGTHKRPIHCTDKKRKTLYIKENDAWNKEGSQNTLKKGIQEVSRKTHECLINEKERNSEEYNNIESDFSEKCFSIQRNLTPGVPQETTINKVIEKISEKSTINE